MSRIFDELMEGVDEVEKFLAGETSGFVVHVPEEIDVKRIRTQMGMTQARFSTAFGFSLDAIKHWEGGRRQPEASARAYLTVIARNPAAVMGALGANPGVGKVKSTRARVAADAKPKPRRAVRRPAKRGEALAISV